MKRKKDGSLYTLNELNHFLSRYLQNLAEAQLLHEAIRLNHYELCHIDDLVKIKNINPNRAIVCLPFNDEKTPYDHLVKSGFYNYLVLKEDHKEINHLLFNFLIKLQLQSFTFRTSDYSTDNLFESKYIHNILVQKNTPPEQKKRISIVMNELLSNAIIHGKTPQPKLEFTIYLDYIALCVSDKSGSLTRNSLDKIYSNDIKQVNPNEFKTAGIGLDTIKMYSDGISIDVQPGHETRVTAFINLKKSLNYCGFILHNEESKELHV